MADEGEQDEKAKDNSKMLLDRKLIEETLANDIDKT